VEQPDKKREGTNEAWAFARGGGGSWDLVPYAPGPQPGVSALLGARAAGCLAGCWKTERQAGGSRSAHSRQQAPCMHAGAKLHSEPRHAQTTS
jgi:hypothetical protein